MGSYSLEYTKEAPRYEQKLESEKNFKKGIAIKKNLLYSNET